MNNNSNEANGNIPYQNAFVDLQKRIRLADPNDPTDIVFLHQVRQILMSSFDMLDPDSEKMSQEELKSSNLPDLQISIDELNSHANKMDKIKRPLGVGFGGFSVALIYFSIDNIKEVFRTNASLFSRIDGITMLASSVACTIAFAHFLSRYDSILKEARKREKEFKKTQQRMKSTETRLRQTIKLKEVTRKEAREAFKAVGKKLAQSSFTNLAGFVGRPLNKPLPPPGSHL